MRELHRVVGAVVSISAAAWITRPVSAAIIPYTQLSESRDISVRDVVSGPVGYLYFCTNNRDGRGNPVTGDDRIARLVPAS